MRLEKNPVINHLKTPETLFKFTIDLHNDVNKSLNKKIYTYEEVSKIYQSHYNGNIYHKNYIKKIFSRNNIILFLIITLICGVGVYLKKKNFYQIKA